MGTERGISWRDLLKYMGVAAAGAAGSSLLSACGSSAPAALTSVPSSRSHGTCEAGRFR